MTLHDFDYPHVDHSSLHRFAATAEDFCRLMQDRRTLQRDIFLRGAHLLIARLYAEGLALPSTDILWKPEDDEDTDEDYEAPPRVQDPDELAMDEWEGAFNGIKEYLGEIDYYRLVFDAWEESAEQPEVMASLADDLADIFSHVRLGLVKWRRGETGAALWEWRFWIENHWGYHATGALRALHARAAWHGSPWPASELKRGGVK